MSYCKQYKSPLPDDDSTLCIVCAFVDIKQQCTHVITYHGEHVCQVTWESYDALLRCGPDKVQSYQTVLILTFDL